MRNYYLKYANVATLKLISMGLQFLWIRELYVLSDPLIAGEYLQMYFYVGAAALIGSMGMQEYLLREVEVASCHYIGFLSISGGIIGLSFVVSIPFFLLVSLLQDFVDVWPCVGVAALQISATLSSVRARVLGAPVIGTLFEQVVPNFLFFTFLMNRTESTSSADIIQIYFYSMAMTALLRELMCFHTLNNRVIYRKTSNLGLGYLVRSVKENKSVCFAFFCASLLSFIAAEFDKFLAIYLLDPAMFGFYSVGYKISILATMGLLAFNVRSKHLFARAFKSVDAKWVSELEKEAVRVARIPPAVLLLFWSLLVPLIDLDLVGFPLEHIYSITVVLLVFQFISMILGPVNSVLMMGGEPMLIVYARLTATALGIVFVLCGLYLAFDPLVLVLMYTSFAICSWKIVGSYLFWTKRGWRTGWCRVLGG